MDLERVLGAPVVAERAVSGGYVAFWLPSLRLEGGPEPEAFDVNPALAALAAGVFACRAGLPEPSAAHNLRAVQRAQLEVALPWAARALSLPRPR